MKILFPEPKQSSMFWAKIVRMLCILARLEKLTEKFFKGKDNWNLGFLSCYSVEDKFKNKFKITIRRVSILHSFGVVSSVKQAAHWIHVLINIFIAYCSSWSDCHNKSLNFFFCVTLSHKFLLELFPGFHSEIDIAVSSLCRQFRIVFYYNKKHFQQIETLRGML